MLLLLLRLAIVGALLLSSSPATAGAEKKSGLTPHEIMDVIRANISHLNQCYDDRLKSDPKLAGTMAFRFIVAMDGSVERARRTGGLYDRELASCFALEILTWKFPKPRGGKVTVNYPFTLTPDA